jgi:nucleoid-associated protein YgaU
VTTSKKVLLAAIILSAGYGMARLLGEPNIALPPQAHPSGGALGTLQPRVTPPHGELTTPTAGPIAIGSARLVPAGPEAPTPQHRAGTTSPRAAVPGVETRYHTAEVVTTGSAAPAAARNSPHYVTPGPRAVLRNEAPRPLTFEPRPTDTNGAEQRRSVQNSAGGLVPAQFARDDVFSGDTSSTPGATANSFNAAHFAPVTAPPSDADQTRAHIVVDGDSLSKLAGRYLDDPHRAVEIYEMNRHLLANPELLPIGVELMIPSRTAAANSVGRSPQSFMPRAVAIHSTVGSGLVPVRPIPPASGLMPRAHLAPPRAAP